MRACGSSTYETGRVLLFFFSFMGVDELPMPLPPLAYSSGSSGHWSTPSKKANAIPPLMWVCMWQWNKNGPGLTTSYRRAIHVLFCSAGVVVYCRETC